MAIGQRWWWVVAFCTVVMALYFPAMNKKRAEIQELSFRLQEMGKEKLMALQETDELRLTLASESDPAWIEMVLMRDLGVVPEGWLKVHFQK